jgi:hypothetical protein
MRCCSGCLSLSDFAIMKKVHIIQIVVVAILAAVAMPIPEKEYPALPYVRKESRTPNQNNRLLMPKTPKSKSWTRNR